jgi:hypothetical protein
MYNLQFTDEEMEQLFTVHEELVKKLKNVKTSSSSGYYSNIVNYVDYVIDNSLFQLEATVHLLGGTPDINIRSKSSSSSSSEKKSEKTKTYYKLVADQLCSYRVNIETKKLDQNSLQELITNLERCKEMSTYGLGKKEEKDLLKNKNSSYHIELDDLQELVDLTSGPSMLLKIRDNQLTRGGIVNTSTAIDGKKEAVQLCEWLMPNAKVTEPNDTKQLTSTIIKHDNLGFIENVYEKDNTRLAILRFNVKNYYGTSLYRKIVLLGHKDTLFNYADAGKVLLIAKYNTYGANSEQIRKNSLLGKAVFIDENTTVPERRVIDYMMEHLRGNDTHLLDDAAVKLFVKKCAEEDLRAQQETDAKRILQDKLSKRLKSLTDNKTILLNNMTISRDNITYEGQELSLEKKNWVIPFLRDLTAYYDFDEINFDTVFEQFITSNSFSSAKGKIGEVAFDINIKKYTNKNHVESTICYINNKRINRLEIGDCLRRALCYTTQDDFNDFIANVSSCSLKFHRYLQSGLEYEVRGLRSSEGFHFKLPLERRKNSMYIVLGEYEFRVRNTNKVIDLQKSRDLGEIIEALLNPKFVEGLELVHAKDLIKLAKIEYSDSIKKSEQLLNETEKTLKLTKQKNITMAQVTVPEGYIVNGKLRKYVVSNSDKCEVYEYPTGRYICIIDKSTSQVGKDKLINRLYALSNDRALAHDIHTLK